MTSLGARIVRALLRLYTYPYRKNHKSLSRSIKLKTKPYKPSANFEHSVLNVCGTNVEKLCLKKSCNPSYAIVQFHGGGHTQSMNKMYRKAAERLCKSLKCSVYSIDYKTGESLEYPSVHDECYFAYVGLLDLLKDKSIIAIGDSFGANLMLSTLLRLRDAVLPLPCASIAVSSFIDLAASGDSYRKNCHTDPLYALPKSQKFEDNERHIRRITPYCGTTSPQHELLSPAYANYDGFPPMLIQCGELETSESDSDTLFEKATSAGVKATLTKYEGMWHDFQYITPFLKESKEAWNEIIDFANRHAI